MKIKNKSSMNLAGVYAIVNTKNGRVYVGSTVRSFKKRYSEHLGDLEKNQHKNRHLQRAWNKFGAYFFLFVILEVTKRNETIALKCEQYWLDRFKPTGVYNIGHVVDNPSLGVKRSSKFKEKLRRYHLGRTLSAETKRKISIANSGPNNPNYGKRHSAETLKKMSDAQRGENHPMYGRRHTAKARRKMSKSRGSSYPAFRNRNTGEAIPAGVNLERLCREKGLTSRLMWGTVYGEHHHHKGWELADGSIRERQRPAPHPALYNKETGEFIPPGINVAKLCEKFGFPTTCIWRLIKGERPQYNGWIIAEAKGDKK